MNTLKHSASNDKKMTGISRVPVPSKLPVRSLPRGARATGELYRASFIISWKSILFFVLAAAAFMAFLYII
jgi:hypothetical protein